MRKILWLVILFPVFTMAQKQEGIHFEESLTWPEVFEKARIERKNIFIDAFATWCGPCKQMDVNVYSRPEVGAYYNEQFVAVKLQIDSTNANNSDNATIPYKKAKEIAEKYSITSLPTFLYLSPDGNLLHRSMGAMNAAAFIQLGKDALIADRQIYRRIQKYRDGDRTYSTLLALYSDVRRTEYASLADSIARDYYHYLDSVNDINLLVQKENIYFVARNSSLIKNSSAIFSLFYTFPQTIDTVVNRKGWAYTVLEEVIIRNEVESKIPQNKTISIRDKVWRSLREKIKMTYPLLDATKIVLNAQMPYYRKKKDWVSYVQLRNSYIKMYPPDVSMQDEFYQLNVPAWDMFLHCDNKFALKSALDWSNYSIALKPEPSILMQCLDTKANILYKLGKKELAILTEEEAIAVGKKIESASSQLKEFELTLEKIKRNEPTWRTNEQ